MKIAVCYHTRTGNTKKLAEAIARALGIQALPLSEGLPEPVDLLFLGSSVYAADVDEEVKRFLHGHAGKIGRLVNVSTAAIARSTGKQVKKLALPLGIPVAEEEFSCRGAFSLLHRGHPNEEDLKKAAAFAVATVNKYGGTK